MFSIYTAPSAFKEFKVYYIVLVLATTLLGGGVFLSL